MRKLAINLIKKYQKATENSNHHCKFVPSCSNYAIEAYEKFNFFYATLLTIWRILRCNPLSKGGFDPVPLTKKEKLTKNTSDRLSNSFENISEENCSPIENS